MAKHKSGQSSQAPKQSAGGGASRSSNPQAAKSHRDYSNSSIFFRYTNRNVLSAKKTVNSPPKPPASGKSSAQVSHSTDE